MRFCASSPGKITGRERLIGFLSAALTLCCALAARPVSLRAPAAVARPAVISPDAQLPAEGGALSTEALVTALEAALSHAQHEKAREILAQLLTRPEINADLLLRIGIEFAQKELYPEAAQAFARAAKGRPEMFETHYNLALADFAQQKFPEALAALEAARTATEPEQLARLYLRGKIKNALGKTTEAERDLSSAFSGAPQMENYALDLGLFYLRQRDYARAAETLERGVALNPRSSYLALGLALAEFLGGRAPQSVETCRKLLRAEPDFSPALLLVAFASYMAGDLEGAEKAAAQGLTGPEPSAYLHYLHATVQLKRQSGDYDRILRELAIAERAIPACSLCYLTASKAHQAQGDTKRAMADLETALRLDPEFSEAWYRLAPLYQSVGRGAEAQHARDEFQKIKSGKEDREAEMLRKMFLQTLSGAEPDR